MCRERLKSKWRFLHEYILNKRRRKKKDSFKVVYLLARAFLLLRNSIVNIHSLLQLTRQGPVCESNKQTTQCVCTLASVFFRFCLFFFFFFFFILKLKFGFGWKDVFRKLKLIADRLNLPHTTKAWVFNQILN